MFVVFTCVVLVVCCFLRCCSMRSLDSPCTYGREPTDTNDSPSVLNLCNSLRSSSSNLIRIPRTSSPDLALQFALWSEAGLLSLLREQQEAVRDHAMSKAAWKRIEIEDEEHLISL